MDPLVKEEIPAVVDQKRPYPGGLFKTFCKLEGELKWVIKEKVERRGAYFNQP